MQDSISSFSELLTERQKERKKDKRRVKLNIIGGSYKVYMRYIVNTVARLL